MIQEFMERGQMLKEQYEVEPIPEQRASEMFLQVKADDISVMTNITQH